MKNEEEEIYDECDGRKRVCLRRRFCLREINLLRT